MTRRAATYLLMIVFACMAMIMSSARPVNDGNEYKVKAMFIYNFIRHVQWPDGDRSKMVRIGVLGESEIFDELNAIAAIRHNDHRKFYVDKITEEQISQYDIVFIPANRTVRFEKSGQFTYKGVLVISESDGERLRKGVVINLLKTDGKIRFELYMSAAKANGIQISENLLKLATKIHK